MYFENGIHRDSSLILSGSASLFELVIGKESSPYKNVHTTVNEYHSI